MKKEAEIQLEETPTAETETPEQAPEGSQEPGPEAEGKRSDNLSERSDSKLVKVRKEAAAYRTKLRESEAQRDALAAKVETLQRAAVEQVASEQLHEPAAIWRGAELADLIDDDGAVKTDQVEETIAAISAEAPYLLKPQGAPPRRPQEALRGGASPTEDPGAASWADVLGSA